MDLVLLDRKVVQEGVVRDDRLLNVRGQCHDDIKWEGRGENVLTHWVTKAAPS